LHDDAFRFSQQFNNRRKEANMTLKEYGPGQAFPGVIGRTFDVSKPELPAPRRAREGGTALVLGREQR